MDLTSFSAFGDCFDTYYNIPGAFCGSLQPLQEDISCLQAKKVSFSCSFYWNCFGVFIAFYSIICFDIIFNALFNIILMLFGSYDLVFVIIKVRCLSI